jgi:ubiquinone/menaquinone biosynthesis C-methylase UbiE
MNNINIQQAYWDSVAGEKTFLHSICFNVLQKMISPEEAILDYGCGYGRTCNELVECGYRSVVGIDISSQMIARGRALYPSIALVQYDGEKLPFLDESFSACVLVAVLTCIPTNVGQEQVISEIQRVLRPGGILYVSDYPIQEDERNQERYRQYVEEFGIYGIFRLPDGGVMRHHDRSWISELLSEFVVIQDNLTEVRTMNGNVANAFQLIVKK